jgi:hypothetical protein
MNDIAFFSRHFLKTSVIASMTSLAWISTGP